MKLTKRSILQLLHSPTLHNTTKDSSGTIPHQYILLEWLYDKQCGLMAARKGMSYKRILSLIEANIIPPLKILLYY
jgi:hypothetical protein